MRNRWGIILGGVAWCAVCGISLLFFGPHRDPRQSNESHHRNQFDNAMGGPASTRTVATQLPDARSASTSATVREARNESALSTTGKAHAQEFAGSLDDQVERAVVAGLISVTEAPSYREERQALLVAEEELQLFEMQEELLDEENEQM